MFAVLKRVLVGRPLASSEEAHQRLSKLVALPVFASDAVSSTAYATDEIVAVLLVQAGVGARAFNTLVPISLIVVVLLAIVVLSYRQTIFAYPSGGGSYIVSRENLGVIPALVAGASLLVDYILTVAVSIAGGVLAIRSAAGLSTSWAVPLCLLCIFAITVANLRGVRESGALFAPPTYIYSGMLLLLITVGLWRVYVGHLGPIPLSMLDEHARHLAAMNHALTLLMLLRAFSSGAVALSGVEAVSNGVPAFRKPESANAARTLMWMAIILGTLFFGVSLLASKLQPFRTPEGPTSIALMAQYVYNGKGVLFWVTQISTFAILTLAANTAYADFPRLSSIIARDGFLPRQLATRGDRLVFSNGIIFLAAVASILIIAFNGDISALIPLYAVGVFTGFTLSQSGMVVHHLRLKEPRWRLSLAINALGAVTTGIVALVVVISKFTEGAWIPAAIIPLLVLLFKGINRHYSGLSTALTIQPADVKRTAVRHTMVVLVGTVHQGVVQALQYAQSLRPDHLTAVHVASSEEEQEEMQRRWDEFRFDVPLEIVSSPYRDINGSIMRYLDEVDERWNNDRITVIIPEFVVRRWWEQLLHNQSALFLKGRLLFRRNIAVLSLPYHVD
jgi:amino acid transporter